MSSIEWAPSQNWRIWASSTGNFSLPDNFFIRTGTVFSPVPVAGAANSAGLPVLAVLEAYVGLTVSVSGVAGYAGVGV
jgi:hypothetical protein